MFRAIKAFQEFAQNGLKEAAWETCLDVLKTASGLQGGSSPFPELKEYLSIIEPLYNKVRTHFITQSG